MTNSTQNNGGFNWNSLLNAIKEEEINCNNIIERAEPTLLLHEEESLLDESRIWSELKNSNNIHHVTNFPEHELVDIWNDVEPIIQATRSRGPLPRISSFDSFIITLIWYKTGLDFEELSAFTHFPKSTVCSAIRRLRPVLLQALQNRWKNKLRPAPLDSRHFPFIALAVDTTSMEIYRPKCRFEEAKMYWDKKNGIYAIKKEVGVRTSFPFYALFVQKGFVGSTHDYSIMKQTYQSYANYLEKSTTEKQLMTSDIQENRWALLGDRAYVGPDADTPSVRRVFIRKNPSTQAELTFNAELSRIRMPVEGFFGRLKKLWKFSRTVYRLSHSEFDEHFEILVWLTNENIRFNALVEADRSFYVGFLQERRNKVDDEKRKHQNSFEQSKEKKKRRTERLFS